MGTNRKPNNTVSQHYLNNNVRKPCESICDPNLKRMAQLREFLGLGLLEWQFHSKTQKSLPKCEKDKCRTNKIKQLPPLTLGIFPETEQDRTVSLFHNQ